MSDLKLNPCPECGIAADASPGYTNCNTAVVISKMTGHDHYLRTQIRCSHCDFTLVGLGEKRMISVWNSLSLPVLEQADKDEDYVEPTDWDAIYAASADALQESIDASTERAEAESYGMSVEEFREFKKEQDQLEAELKASRKYEADVKEALERRMS